MPPAEVTSRLPNQLCPPPKVTPEVRARRILPGASYAARPAAASVTNLTVASSLKPPRSPHSRDSAGCGARVSALHIDVRVGPGRLEEDHAGARVRDLGQHGLIEVETAWISRSGMV